MSYLRREEIKKEGSQGIELAVVKKINKNHNGGILVQTSAFDRADLIYSWPAKKPLIGKITWSSE